MNSERMKIWIKKKLTQPIESYRRHQLLHQSGLYTALMALVFSATLEAHQPGNSSIALKVQEDGSLQGEYHVADVDVVSINLMLEDALRNSRGDMSTHFDPQLNGVKALSWLTIKSAGTPVEFAPGLQQVVTTENGPHTMIPFTTGPVNAKRIEVTFNDFFQFDPQHTVNIELELPGQSKVGIISLENPVWTPAESAFAQFVVFTIEGIWHIWIGIDHILFLVALLLPSVLRLENGKWNPVSNFKDAFYNVLKVVTAFTIAHSVTLTLAALDIVTLPSKFVESVIALSVVLAALNNIFPIVSDRVWAVAFGFGLIHGFGFANVLADLELPTGTLAIALFSFNIGVELGQLAIVLAFFPVIFFFRKQAFYQPVNLRFGSAVIAMIASLWIVDRVFELEFMPF